MGKTADLTMIQKTNIDTLHKEGKSQKVITEMLRVLCFINYSHLPSSGGEGATLTHVKKCLAFCAVHVVNAHGH